MKARKSEEKSPVVIKKENDATRPNAMAGLQFQVKANTTRKKTGTSNERKQPYRENPRNGAIFILEGAEEDLTRN
jgi:hypothetical protein